MSHDPWLLVAVALGLPAGAVIAQDEAGQSPAGDTVLAADAPTPPAPSEAVAHVGIDLGEIIVTAQKREQDINDVPIAISAFTGESLSALGVTDIRDVGKLVPGLNVSDSGGGTPIYTLRGMGFSDTTYTATGNVGLYVDEVNMPYSVMTKGPSLDIQRVEVVKGPQGTLYGRNTTGGLINQIANKPSETLEAGVTYSLSRFLQQDVEGFLSGPLMDSVRGRVAVRYIHADDGWQYSNTRPDDTLGRKDKGAARGLIDWEPIDSLFFELGVHYWWDHGEPQAPQAVDTVPQNPFIGALGLSPAVLTYPLVPKKGADPQVADWQPNEDWKLRDSFFMTSLKGIWNVTDSTSLTTILSYIEMRADGSSQIQSGLDIYNVEDTGNTAHIRSKSIEARLSGLFGEDLRWMLGVNVGADDGGEDHNLRVDSISAFNLLIPTNVGGVPIVPDLRPLLDMLGPTGSGPYFVNSQNVVSNHLHVLGYADIDQYAAFVNMDWAFVENFNLNFGVRYTVNNQHFWGCGQEDPDSEGIIGLSNVFTALSAVAAAQYTARTGRPGNPSVVMRGQCWVPDETGSIDPFSDNLDENNVSGRVALDWKPERGEMYYASVGRGYKAGGFPVVNPANQAQYVPVTQEKLLAYEVGTKQELFDGVVNAAFTTFYYDYDDKQLLTKTPDPVFGALPILKNAPKSTVYGAELEVQANPVEGLFLATAASYLHTRIDEFTSTDSEGNVRDFKGKPFNFAPEYQVNLVGDYTWLISARLTFGIGADLAAVGKTNGTLDTNPKFDMPAHQLLGARLHLAPTDKKWSASIFGRNLTNELYSAGTFNVGDMVGRFAGYPRTYGVTLGYNF